MTGTYEHTIDAKGRMFLPAKLRQPLGSVFYAAMGAQMNEDGSFYKYVTFYPLEKWEELKAKVAEMPSSSTSTLDTFFSNACRCEPDAQYRIALSDELRTYAGLGKDVVTIGSNDKAKLWSREVWEEKKKKETTPENVAKTLAMLGL